MQVENSHIKEEKKNLIVLEPMPVGKWLLAIVLLLSFPLAILVDQMIASFAASKDQAIGKMKLQVEKLAGRAVVEQPAEIQMREILEEYQGLIKAPLEELVVLNRSGLKFFDLPYVSAKTFTDLIEKGLRLKLERLERRLRQIIPGIKLLKWGPDFKVLPVSDQLLPKFVFRQLAKAIGLRTQERIWGKGSYRSYARSLPHVQRYYADDPRLFDFVKYGEGVQKFITASGIGHYLFWHSAEDLEFAPGVSTMVEGFLSRVEEDSLPPTFGLNMFAARKSHEWKDSGLALGWVDSQDNNACQLPYPFISLDREFWIEWIANQPNGLFEKKGLVIAIRKIDSQLAVVAAVDIQNLYKEFHRQVFLLIFGLALTVTFALWVAVLFRKNNGAAISIKGQMMCLFALALIVPSAAVFHLGISSLGGLRESYENKAFKEMEQIRKEIEENSGYVFQHLEVLGSEFIRGLIKHYKPDKKRPFEGKEVNNIIDEYCHKAQVKQLFLFNAAGREIFKYKPDSAEKKGILPLVSSLAKLKLRLSGKLVQEGYSGSVSLMDLMIEETGGAKLSDLQSLLKTKNCSAFELKFTDRRTYFFVGQFSPENYPDTVFILIFVIKDRSFDPMYLELMIEKMQQEKKIGEKIQVFYGPNNVSSNLYFRDSCMRNPFFRFDKIGADSVGIGRLTEATRFSGASVKDSYVFENGHRALFYSYKPSGIEAFTVMSLYDYSEISNQLEILKILIVVVFLVSGLVIYVLGKITARSIIQPVLMLKEAVQSVEAGDFSSRVILPGEDELVNLSVAFNSMSQGLDEREKMTRYLSKSAVEAVKTGAGAALGGLRVPATILFSDIRSFTTISESHDAEIVVGLLNDYFACMNVVIEEFDGDIDKFIGDAIMAQFIARDSEGFKPEEMALKAVKCALEMMASLKRFNLDRESRGLFPIMIGVGINSGEVITGNIGSPGRMDHTVIGDVVNVASRLEGMSKNGKFTHVIISRATLEMIEDHVQYSQLEETAVKGKTSAVEMFEVISCLN